MRLPRGRATRLSEMNPHIIDPSDLTESEARELLRRVWPDEMIEASRQGRTYRHFLATWQRFSSPLFLVTDDYTAFRYEVHNANGDLVVGEGYTVETPEKRRTTQALLIAARYTRRDDDRLAIALRQIPEPEDETDEERATRLLETRKLAYRLAGQGDFSVAIELGYLPKPKVEPQPRMVDKDGNLVQEEIAIEFEF